MWKPMSSCRVGVKLMVAPRVSAGGVGIPARVNIGVVKVQPGVQGNAK